MAKSGSKIVLAGLAGLAAGIALGVLFAPSKGSKMRKRLKKKILNYADILEDGLSDKFNAFKSSLSKGDNDEEEEIEEEEQTEKKKNE
ncbi:MAG: YtxH domain-containing protein [Bacteroidota bacterium]|nr:YtxH domain-containing protein [Bacteroidota bacterium]